MAPQPGEVRQGLAAQRAHEEAQVREGERGADAADGAILWQKRGDVGVYVDAIERSDGSFVCLAYVDAQYSQITIFGPDGTMIRNMRQLEDVYPPANEQLLLLPDDGFATLEGVVTDPPLPPVFPAKL